MTETLHIVDLWQYHVCCTRSGLTHCTLFMVLFLCRMCRCGLHVALHIGTHMRLLAAEPRSIAGLLFPFHYLCGAILVTPYSIVWEWRVSRVKQLGQCHFTGLAAHSIFVSSCFAFLFFHSMGRYCEVGVFGLIVCQSLSPGLAVPTFFNNNNNDNNNTCPIPLYNTCAIVLYNTCAILLYNTCPILQYNTCAVIYTCPQFCG